MAMTGAIKVVLVSAALLWFAGDSLLVSGSFSSYYDKKFEDILVETFMDWLPLISFAYQYGPPEAHQTLADYLDYIYEECYRHHNYKASADILKYIEQLKEKFKEFYEKMKAKNTVKAIIVKLVPRLIIRFGQKAVLQILLNTATHPLGYVADAAQVLLEVFVNETAGKVVGAGGNILAGAISGYVVGGPPGAVIGGVFGFGIWGVGELACYEDVKEVENFIKLILTIDN